MSGTRHRSWSARLAALALLSALFAKVLTPDGWMPAAHALVFCTAHGQTLITVGEDGAPVSPDPGGKAAAHDLCPFATAAHFLQAAQDGPRLTGLISAAYIPAAAPDIEGVASRPLRRGREQAPRAPPILA